MTLTFEPRTESRSVTLRYPLVQTDRDPIARSDDPGYAHGMAGAVVRTVSASPSAHVGGQAEETHVP